MKDRRTEEIACILVKIEELKFESGVDSRLYDSNAGIKRKVEVLSFWRNTLLEKLTVVSAPRRKTKKYTQTLTLRTRFKRWF